MSEMSGTELVDWRALPPGQRRAWWDHIWEDAIQVEALAAFICWLELYDSGANGDPTGKLQLLWELERLRGVLRAGEHAFHAGRDRRAFEEYVARILGTDAMSADAGSRDGRNAAASNFGRVEASLS